MIDYTTELVETLNTVLPSYHESFFDSTKTVPCITYIQTMNSESATGNTLGWSTIQYRIKLWANTVNDIVEYSEQIDDAMAELGEFERITCTELLYNNTICRIMDYNILVKEIYKKER